MQSGEIGKSLIIGIKEKEKKVIIDLNETKIKLNKTTFDSLNLKIGDSLTETEISEILSKDKVEDIIKYCKNLLIKKPYSEGELIKKANAHFMYPREMKRAIQELKKVNLVDDHDYLLNYLDYFKKEAYGKYFIINFFRNQGVKASLIDEIDFSEEEEEEKATIYFETLKNKFTGSNFAKTKRKIYDSMLRRGFGVEVILNVISRLQIDEEKELKQLVKEYKKIKLKVEKKAESSTKGKYIDKDALIVNKLVNLGYSLNMIKSVIEMNKKGELDD